MRVALIIHEREIVETIDLDAYDLSKSSARAAFHDHLAAAIVRARDTERAERPAPKKAARRTRR